MPLCVGLMGAFDALSYLIVIEQREKKKLEGEFSAFLAPSVVKKIMESGMDPRAEVGQKQELSVLFSDIRGFTTLSETLPPEKLVETLNQYLGKMTDIVFEYDGTLDKFIGDAVMAFWGAPNHDPEHARKSLEAALSMTEALALLNKDWVNAGSAVISIGIGINTGTVTVGNIGSAKKTPVHRHRRQRQSGLPDGRFDEAIPCVDSDRRTHGRALR